MAFASFTRTLPTPSAALSSFVCLLTESWWTQADANAMDGTTFINGGGSIRCYTDSSKTTQLPVEVVEFVTGGTPSAQVWVRVPSYSGASTTIYIESDAVATTQPAVTDTYGRNAVWQDYEGAFLCQDTSWTDSSGNGDLTVDGSTAPTVVSTALGNAYRFNASDSTHLTRALTSSITAGPITVQVQFINRGTPAYTLYAGGVSGTAGGRDFSVGGISGSSSLQIRDTFPVNQGRQFVVDTVAGSVGDVYRVDSVFDSGNLTSSGWINGTFGTDTIARTLTSTLVNLGIGGRIDGSPDYYDVDVASFRVLTVARSQDHLDTERENEVNNSSFGTSSGWTTGGGGVTGDVDLTVGSPVFSLSGSATLPSPSGDINFNVDKPLFSVSGSATLPAPIGNASITIDKPLFSSSGSATLPQPSGNASLTIESPAFSASGSATVPFPQGDIAFNIEKPVFSASGSSTQPNPSGNVSFDVSKPLFNADGAATLPNPTGSAGFTIDSPTFNATGSASLPYPVGNANVVISSPTFSATGSSTLPQPSGTVSFNISEPIFAVSGTVSGLVVPIGITLKPNFGSNIIKLQAASNIIKL